MTNTISSKTSLKRVIVMLLIVISCLMLFSACSSETKTEVITDVTKVQIIDAANLHQLTGYDATHNNAHTFVSVSRVEITGDLVTIFIGDKKIATTHIQNVIFFYN